MGVPTKTMPPKPAPPKITPPKQALQAETAKRRSMRVLLSVPIRVTGKTKDNKDFDEETRTLVVNAHGALISLAAKLSSGQQIIVHNTATDKSMKCRIAYLGSPAAGKVQMGIEFVEPCASFWQIDFPPEDWVVPEN
jgi:hypothetical protein